MSKSDNTHCPWSGKPVSDDSLTLFEGRTVGFCNPGCRDSFEKAVKHFRENRPQVNPLPSISSPTVYEPRCVRSAAQWQIGEMTLKVYTITAEEEETADTLRGMERFAKLALPTARAAVGHDHGIGYAILHHGIHARWALIHWWAFGDTLLSLLGRAPLNGVEFLDQSDERFHHCVWEHEVIHHERNAWRKHMMRAVPDLEGYIQDRLHDGWY